MRQRCPHRVACHDKLCVIAYTYVMPTLPNKMISRHFVVIALEQFAAAEADANGGKMPPRGAAFWDAARWLEEVYDEDRPEQVIRAKYLAEREAAYRQEPDTRLQFNGAHD